MPRAGLTGADVVASAAGLADEIGFQGVTMGLLADRLGVRAPSLYKHVGGLGDVRHRLAILAVTELGETVRDAAAGRSGRDALAAVLSAIRAYVSAHPGRWAATIGTEYAGPDDPLAAAGARVMNLIAAVLRGYGLEGEPAIHAVRTVRSALHGFVTLEREGGFGLPIAIDESYDRLIDTLDAGLAASS